MTKSRSINGTQIRDARLAKGWSQMGLAQAAGVSERNIARWEKNHNSPRAEHIAAIAAATGCDIEFFYESGGDDEDEQEAAPAMAADLFQAAVAAAVVEALARLAPVTEEGTA